MHCKNRFPSTWAVEQETILTLRSFLCLSWHCIWVVQEQTLPVARMVCATLSSPPCTTKPASSHKGQLLEREALLLPPWTPIGMSLKNSYAANRELKRAEIQLLHEQGQPPRAWGVLWPVLEDPAPNVLPGARTLFHIWGPGLQAPGRQAEQQVHFLPLTTSRPEKPQTAGLGGAVGATSSQQSGPASAPDARASWEILYWPKSFCRSGLCSCSFDSTGLTPLRNYSCFVSLWNNKREEA